jgi:site-specific recombinase XerD
MISISIIIANINNPAETSYMVAKMTPTELKIGEAIQLYLDNVNLARSENTARSYRNAMNAFASMLANKALPQDSTNIQRLSEDAIAWFAASLKDYAPATEQMYLTAAAGFFEFLAAERITEPNLPRLRLLIRQRSRRSGQRLPQFPESDIDKALEYANNIASSGSAENDADYLRNLRDRAFLLTLADTGLRVHEACKLRRGDLDWNEARAIVIGKGDRQAIVRFTRRSLTALKDYLGARAGLDGASGRPLGSLPLFARHDRGAGKKVKAITTTTGRNIVAQRVEEALGQQAVGSITPHSFRHYFVTTVLRGSGGNLKLAQELARHRNIAVTQRYAHLSDDELDKGYWQIFEDDSGR